MPATATTQPWTTSGSNRQPHAQRALSDPAETRRRARPHPPRGFSTPPRPSKGPGLPALPRATRRARHGHRSTHISTRSNPRTSRPIGRYAPAAVPYQRPPCLGAYLLDTGGLELAHATTDQLAPPGPKSSGPTSPILSWPTSDTWPSSPLLAAAETWTRPPSPDRLGRAADRRTGWEDRPMDRPANSPTTGNIVIEWTVGHDPNDLDTYAWKVTCEPTSPDEMIAGLLAEGSRGSTDRTGSPIRTSVAPNVCTERRQAAQQVECRSKPLCCQGVLLRVAVARRVEPLSAALARVVGLSWVRG